MALSNIYLWLDGIDGESHDLDHHGWIEVEDFTWGASNDAKSGTGQSGSGQGGKSKTIGKVNPLTVTKETDKASVTLFQSCVMGSEIDRGLVSCMKLDGETRVEYLKIELKKIYVEKVDWSKGDGEQHKETVVFNFAEFKEIYAVQRNRGFSGGVTEFGFNIETSTAT